MKLSKPIHRLKSDAKKLVSEKGVPLHAALDQIAKVEGYNAWSQVAREWSAQATEPFDIYLDKEREQFILSEQIVWPRSNYKWRNMACPFCGDDELLCEGEGDDYASIGCDNCGAEGPRGALLGEARRLWDIRSQADHRDACPFCGVIAQPSDTASQPVRCTRCHAGGPSPLPVEDEEEFQGQDALYLWQLRTSST